MEITGSHLIKWGRPIQPVRVRPAVPFDPTSADGRVDWVAVDRALQGLPTRLTPHELDEVCRVLDELRREYHNDEFDMRYDDRRSPYLIIKDLLIDAYGPQFDVLYDRYREKMTQRRRRAAKKEAQEDGSDGRAPAAVS